MHIHYITPEIDGRKVLVEAQKQVEAGDKTVAVHYHKAGERCNALCVVNFGSKK